MTVPGNQDPPIVIQLQIHAGTIWTLMDDGTIWARPLEAGAEWRWVPGPMNQWIEREMMLKQCEDHPVIYDQD